MKHLKNERGNAAIFLLWLLGIVALVFIITVNIVKVYVVNEQGSMAVDQAALTGTAELISRTTTAIEKYESKSEYAIFRLLQLPIDGNKSVSQLINEQKQSFISQGYDESISYIRALNNVLTDGLLYRHGFLKFELRQELGSERDRVPFLIQHQVHYVINQNDARSGPQETTIELSSSNWRVEVKTQIRFDSISDNKFIGSFIEDIPQRGYGPTLSYLSNVYSGSINYPPEPDPEPDPETEPS